MATQQAPTMLTRPLLLVFGVGFGAMCSFWLLLSVVPMYMTVIGADGSAAGLATAALMLTTVAAELVIPRLVARLGYRAVNGVGLLLLGAPALVLPLAGDTVTVIGVCLVRGLGFAIAVVVGGAMAAALMPAERRGEGLGIQAIVSGIPAVGALPAGVWLVDAVGYGPVFVAGAVAALAGLAAIPGLPTHLEPTADDTDGHPTGVVAGLRSPGLRRPALVFATTAIAAGITVTFLPLAAPDAGAGLVATALLVQSVASTASRWWAGRIGDRHGAGTLLVPGIATSAAGVLMLVLVTDPAVLIAAMVVFGLGFGVTQSATLALMFQRVPRSEFGTVSALWNLGYDAGYGIGAAGFGILAAQTGYATAFALVAVPIVLALRPAWRDRH